MSFTLEEQQLLEAYGFDLLAQLEAMLRHVREYQRGLQRFRGMLPRPNAKQTPIERMGDHVRSLRDALTEFNTCLAQIEERLSSPGKGEKPKQAAAGLVRPDPARWRNTSTPRARRRERSRS
jgi:hypothetical protein